MVTLLPATPPLERGDGRRKVLFACAGIILLFGLTDYFVLQRVSAPAVAARLIWAALTIAVALQVGRVPRSRERRLFELLGASCGLFFGLLVYQTGGFDSPLFHWMLSVPLTVAVVVQDHPRATLATGITTLLSGFVLLNIAGQPAAYQVSWGIQAFAMSALAYYASVTYRRLRHSESALRTAGETASERAREEHAARSRAEKAARARDELISIASHELKNPLTPLKLRLETAIRLLSRDQASIPQQVFKHLDGAVNQIERISLLIDNLLDVSRIDAGRMSLDLDEETDLVESLRDVVERFAEQVARSGSVITIRADAPVRGRWDGPRLEQVILNVLSNAVKYGAGQPVEVSIEREDGWVRLRVRDQGPGIAVEDIERIFQKFERAEAARRLPGLGLGLFISREIVEMHGGTIEVASRPGETIFTIRLPLDPG